MTDEATAKMADGARRLPKWQALANPVPNSLPNWHSKYRAKENNFSPNFLFLQMPIPYGRTIAQENDTPTRERVEKMKTVYASVRFVTGDVVSWTSKSGNQYTGSVVGIKEGANDDLIIVELSNGQHRSFYDNATDWKIVEEV